VALFAITLNFLQPLAHAALMRDGGPTDWVSMCLPGAGQDDQQGSTPADGKQHECCLALPRAGAGHAIGGLRRRRATLFRRRPSSDGRDALAIVGIRDGPSQPRAPPSFV